METLIKFNCCIPLIKKRFIQSLDLGLVGPRFQTTGFSLEMVCLMIWLNKWNVQALDQETQNMVQ